MSKAIRLAMAATLLGTAAIADNSIQPPAIVAVRNALNIRSRGGHGAGSGGGLAGQLLEGGGSGGIRTGGRLFGPPSGGPSAEDLRAMRTSIRPPAEAYNRVLGGAPPSVFPEGGPKPPEGTGPSDDTELPRTEPPYTGLVVDCRGLGLQRARSPRIVAADGTEVWGTVAVDPQVMNELGLVGYLATVDEALNPALCRAGGAPLFVRAVNVAGNFKADPVVSEADAQLIRTENERNGFVAGLTVVFLVD